VDNDDEALDDVLDEELVRTCDLLGNAV